PLRFHTPNALHVRGISKKVACLMFKAGFKSIRLGLETAVFEKRGSLDRKVSEKEFHSAVSALLSSGFEKDQVGAYLLTGLPDQNISDLKQSIRIVKECGIQPVLAYYSPIPKTVLWDRAVKTSRYPLEADPIFTNNAVFPCRKEPFSWDTLSEIKALTSGETEPEESIPGRVF
ncbi:MAG: B12-binding domain-containing radical SAM protein, partial [Thermodesulfobacteriota bacterium]